MEKAPGLFLKNLQLFCQTCKYIYVEVNNVLPLIMTLTLSLLLMSWIWIISILHYKLARLKL